MRLQFEHTALSVANLERSITFYCELLQCTLLRIIDCPPDGRFGDVVGIPRCSARLAHVQSVNGHILELFEYRDPQGSPIPHTRSQADYGFTHLGLRTDDIWQDYHRLVAYGVEFYSEPTEYRPGVWMAYFYGPDHETCELRQVIA
jgi:catechol 2,3-dioxygenase-like lactoylglutathione lyase family enzyme